MCTDDMSITDSCLAKAGICCKPSRILQDADGKQIRCASDAELMQDCVGFEHKKKRAGYPVHFFDCLYSRS